MVDDYTTVQSPLAGRNKVIAKLDNCNDNERRHGWSEQEIHTTSFPENWADN
jgi:hypothetical protein